MVNNTAVKLFTLLFVILISTSTRAQTDSIVRYWAYNPVTQVADIQTNNPAQAKTREVYYHYGDSWKMESHFLSSGKLYMRGGYKNGEGTINQGEFVRYFENGNIAFKGVYENGKENGLHESWYQDGKKAEFFFMKNGIITGHSKSWDKDGNLSVDYSLDEFGKGMVTVYNGNMIYSKGNYIDNKKDGEWTYYSDEGGKQWEVSFVKDSVASYKCFDKSGKESANCIFEKEATPAGGIEAWKNYLTSAVTKANYPSKKTMKSTGQLSGEVVIRFLIEKDGTIADVQVISSLNEEADRIARDAILHAPKWTAGIYQNKVVRSYHTQPFSFVVNLK